MTNQETLRIMAKKKNLSEHKKELIPTAKNMTIGIVVAEWNPEITDALCNGAIESLKENGIPDENIKIEKVPGTFELTLGGQFMAEYNDVDAVICLGCVIQGETRHFDFICNAVSAGITQLNINYNIPFIFGVLTTDNFEQAKERSGGKHGNKGVEAGVTAIKMVALQKKLEDC